MEKYAQHDPFSRKDFNWYVCKCIGITLLYIPTGHCFLLKNPLTFFRRPQITKQMLISFASFWLLLRKPKWAICVLDQNPCSKRDHPSHAEALIPAHYSAFWDQDHLFALTARSDGTFCWRLWKTTNYLQDAASKCDDHNSFIPYRNKWIMVLDHAL